MFAYTQWTWLKTVLRSQWL